MTTAAAAAVEADRLRARSSVGARARGDGGADDRAAGACPST